MPETSLGLMMILRNEATNLERSLAPVAHLFDQVVAVDTGSSDPTPEICSRLGAQVFHQPWNHDFAATRNYALSQAETDWVFWLDGDNSLEPNDVAALRALLPGSRPAILWALEQVVPQGGRLWQKRCFPRRPEVSFQGRVHEQLVHPPHWPSIVTPVVVRHWGYADSAVVEQKGRYYLHLLSQTLQEDPQDFYARFQSARCLMNLRRFEEATRHLELVVADQAAQAKNRQIWAHAHFLWAECLQRLGQPGRGQEVLDNLLAQVEGMGLAHYHRGRLAYSLGDWEGAARHLQRGFDLGLDAPLVDVDPDKTLFLCNYFLGRALEYLERAEDAVKALQQAVAREPVNAAARTHLARLLWSQGRKEEARRHVLRVLSQRPYDRQALRLRNLMERAA